MGVYGDHAKPGGWNDRILEESFARQRAKETYTPASNELAFVEGWLANGRIDKANSKIQKAGLLAAAEARIRHGVQINGWESANAEAEYRSFYDIKTIEFAGRIAAAEARAHDVGIEGWEPDSKAA